MHIVKKYALVLILLANFGLVQDAMSLASELDQELLDTLSEVFGVDEIASNLIGDNLFFTAKTTSLDRVRGQQRRALEEHLQQKDSYEVSFISGVVDAKERDFAFVYNTSTKHLDIHYDVFTLQSIAGNSGVTFEPNQERIPKGMGGLSRGKRINGWRVECTSYERGNTRGVRCHSTQY